MQYPVQLGSSSVQSDVGSSSVQSPVQLGSSSVQSDVSRSKKARLRAALLHAEINAGMREPGSNYTAPTTGAAQRNKSKKRRKAQVT